MNVHNYHPTTGEYLGTSVADTDPLDPSRKVLPAFSTTETPPDDRAGFARVWSGNAWSYVADHRGETWFTAEGETVEIEDLGDPADKSLLPEMPELPEPQPTVPDVVSGVAARHVLRSTPATSGSGTLYDQIKAALGQLPEPTRILALAALDEAPTFRRTGSQLINSLNSAVGLSDDMIDQLFIAAAAVDAQI